MKIYPNYSISRPVVQNNRTSQKQYVRNVSNENLSNENALAFKGFKLGIGTGMLGALAGFALGGPIGAAIVGTLAGAAGGSADDGDDSDLSNHDVDRATDRSLNDFPTVFGDD